MSNYKRLTEKTKHGIAVLDSGERFVLSCGGYATTKALNRLAELEDRIENGTLVELPRIIHPNEQEWFVQYQYESGIINCNVFYSEAEAEAKLKELREKEECR